MSRVKVLGLGSPFGDDVLGWLVVDALAEDGDFGAHCEFARHDRPGVRLIDLMSEHECVILIDAIYSGQAIGTIHTYFDEEVFEVHSGLSTHQMGVSEALRLARALNAIPPKLIIYGIEADIHRTHGVSVPVQKAIEVLVPLVKEVLLQGS